MQQKLLNRMQMLWCTYMSGKSSARPTGRIANSQTGKLKLWLEKRNFLPACYTDLQMTYQWRRRRLQIKFWWWSSVFTEVVMSWSGSLDLWASCLFLLLVLCWGALNEVQAIESYLYWIQSLKIVQQALKADILNRVRVLCVGGCT